MYNGVGLKRWPRVKFRNQRIESIHVPFAIVPYPKIDFQFFFVENPVRARYL
jgi:hypothetical protein